MLTAYGRRDSMPVVLFETVLNLAIVAVKVYKEEFLSTYIRNVVKYMMDS